MTFSLRLPVPIPEDREAPGLPGLDAADVLEVYALRLAALRGKRPSKRLLRRTLSPEQVRLWSQLAMTPAMMLQDRLMAIALHGQMVECPLCFGEKVHQGQECPRCRGRGRLRAPADPRLVKLAHDAALDTKDRVLGKPTEHVQIAQAVQVIVGGVDLSKLPSAQSVETEAESLTQSLNHDTTDGQ